MSTDTIEARAYLAAEQVVTTATHDEAHTFGRATVEHIARLAWLDGFQAGHSDATKNAIEVLRGQS